MMIEIYPILFTKDDQMWHEEELGESIDIPLGSITELEVHFDFSGLSILTEALDKLIIDPKTSITLPLTKVCLWDNGKPVENLSLASTSCNANSKIVYDSTTNSVIMRIPLETIDYVSNRIKECLHTMNFFSEELWDICYNDLEITVYGILKESEK